MPDYEERRQSHRATFEQRDGQQAGDPARLAGALVALAADAAPPMRFVAGRTAVDLWATKLEKMGAELARWRELGAATDFPDA